ncbi:MAG: thiamine/thiamine pyrophosphate ABC transporter permease ThiP [Cypionkella sp.]|nr:thiamine/thiamine pyrophosphate ABC transporter permease ThiP [Cypionkella sp.]
MANRAIAVAAAPVAAALVLLLMAAGLVPLLARTSWGAVSPADWAALRFTILQAALSATCTCLLAIPLARALHRRCFWGRGALIKMLSAPFVLPTLAAIMGLLALFGSNGPVSSLLVAVGLSPIPIFGLGGVVLAHVFLNLPLATRMLLQSWAAIPTERFRLAQSLSLTPLAHFRHLEWPMLRAILPSAFAAIFLICLTSFAVALILGGGPRASTVELGIYQSLRFEFNLERAARLALIQVVMGFAAVLLLATIWRAPNFGVGLDRPLRMAAPKGFMRIWDAAVIGLLSAFLILPMLAVLAKGLPMIAHFPNDFAVIALRSVAISISAAVLSVTLALTLARARAKGAGIWVEIAAMLPLGTSSLALGTGVFLALLQVVTPQTVALPLAVIFNAAFSLPFVFRILLPACREIEANFSRLSAQLGLSPWAEVRVLFFPRLRKPIGFCAGLAAAMAMGDFGVIALFGGQDQTILPILIARLMGSYQMQAAAAVTLWLVLFAFALFWTFDALGGRDADA